MTFSQVGALNAFCISELIVYYKKLDTKFATLPNAFHILNQAFEYPL